MTKVLKNLWTLASIFILCSCGPAPVAEKTFPDKVRTADDFALLDHTGKFHQLSYYSDHKAVVLISQGNGCPIIRQTIKQINQLSDEYSSRGVVFLMINANSQDDRASIVQEAKEFGIRIPVLEDNAQFVSRSLDLTRIAEAIVIDPSNWKIIYQGPVDDRLNYETQKIFAGKHYLKDVLDRLLDGKDVVPVKIPAKGCLIGFEYGKQLTYVHDVTPILIKSCLPCHSPGGVAPWSMDDYNKVKGWGRMISESVRVKRMPPWQADSHYGSFSNDIALTPEEMRTLVDWVDQGFVRGEGDDPLLTAPRPQFKEWELGQPDVIFSLSEEQNLPSTGVIAYKIVPADKPIEEDMWVRAVDLQPGNRKSVHHCDVAVQLPQDLATAKEASAQSWSKRSGMFVDGVGQIIAGYAPGYDSYFVLPEGSGLFIPKGSALNFWMHYIATGKPEKDMTRFGVYLHKEKPSRVYSFVHLSNKAVKIPPGEKEYRISASHVFDRDVVLTSLAPHMHFRGHSMRLTADYPDGTTEVLLSVPNFKFSWQRRYIFTEPKKIPAGTRITADGVFDNSAQNLDNPDPSKTVTFGSQSEDEMFSAFIAYMTDNDSL